MQTQRDSETEGAKRPTKETHPEIWTEHAQRKPGTPPPTTTPDGLKVFDSPHGLVVLAHEHNRQLSASQGEAERLRGALSELFDDASEADAAICGFLGGCDAREVRQSFPDFKLASDKLDLSLAKARALLVPANRGGA